MSKSPNRLHAVTALHAVRDKAHLVPHRVAETAVALLVTPHARVAMTRAPAPVNLVVTTAHPLVVMSGRYAMNREPAAVPRAMRARAAVAPRAVTNPARTELHVAMTRAMPVQAVVRMSVRVAMHARRAVTNLAMHDLSLIHI